MAPEGVVAREGRVEDYHQVVELQKCGVPGWVGLHSLCLQILDTFQTRTGTPGGT